jgi:hypothetical protein
MGCSSAELGYTQVRRVRILLQTPFASPAAIDDVQSHARATGLFRQRGLVEQVATREPPGYLKSCLRLLRLVSPRRVDRLGVSASEGTYA